MSFWPSPTKKCIESGNNVKFGNAKSKFHCLMYQEKYMLSMYNKACEVGHLCKSASCCWLNFYGTSELCWCTHDQPSLTWSLEYPVSYTPACISCCDSLCILTILFWLHKWKFLVRNLLNDASWCYSLYCNS